MSKLKEYNTAVIAIDKNGKERKYKSLEEASKETGLSVRAIKSRAVNQGKSGKDGLTFRFVEPHTKRAFTAKRSKQKGNRFELEIVNQLREIGYKQCVSSRSESKNLDNSKIDVADPTNELPCYIQAKNTANFPNYFKIEEECPLKDKPFVIAYKKAYNDGTRSPISLAIIPLDYFYKLISKK